MSISEDDRSRLRPVLEEARQLGFLGPGPIEAHIEHALGFGADGPAPARALDLGSGGGVPGLVLAVVRWPTCRWTLLDAGKRRCAFLEWACDELALAARVTVRWGRAEEAGREPELRGTIDLVTARGFAAPGITAECAAPFLASGGRLEVSEPPSGSTDRWSTQGLALLGLGPAVRSLPRPGVSIATMARLVPCPDRYPRRVGIPAKRPLF